MNPMISYTGIALLLLPITLWAADLQVNIDGLRHETGFVNVALFNSETHFLNTDAMLSGKRLKANSTIRTRFTDLQPGTYAISVYHDANGNGKLDKNLLGMPTESYGFSNNAVGIGRAPSFSQAAFTLETVDKTISITLR